jgi:hypothetical protein
MKETVAAFEKRTGEHYSPPLWLQALGTPLSSRQPCPTLFRFPGPEGLQALFQDRLQSLGPSVGRAHLWLTSRPTGAYPRPVALFGTVALLQPLHLAPCRTHCFTHTRDNWIALERAVEPQQIAWVPPSFTRSFSFDRIASADDARRRFGPDYAAERRRVEERLSAYLEELSELRRAGAPGPRTHWCSVPARERRALLAACGLRPRWTGAA